jgi:hypothetical protein
VVSNAVIRSGEEDVTYNYEVTYVEGTLTVTPRRITVTAGSNTKEYDGWALTDDSFICSREDGEPALVLDHQITVTVEGSITNVGNVPNVASNAVIRSGEEDVTYNYEVTYVDGTLTVTPRRITVTAGSDTKPYDGTPLTNPTYTVSREDEQPPLVLDHQITVTVEGSITNVGVEPNVVTNAVIRSGEEDVTDNYDITFAEGTLTITKRQITVTAAKVVREAEPCRHSGRYARYKTARGSCTRAARRIRFPWSAQPAQRKMVITLAACTKVEWMYSARLSKPRLAKKACMMGPVVQSSATEHSATTEIEHTLFLREIPMAAPPIDLLSL